MSSTLDLIRATAAKKGIDLILDAGTRNATRVPASSYSPPPVATTQPNISQFLGANSTANTLGINAFNRALQSGLSADQIRNAASAQGLSIGSGLQQQFSSQPATRTAPQSQVNLSQFLGANSTANTLGAEAFNRAIQSGLTPQQVASAAAAQGFNIGSGAQQQFVQPQVQQTSKFDKNAGLGKNLKAAGNTLSQSELNKLAKISGKTKDQILQQAVQKGLSIGSKVVNQYQSDSKFFPDVITGTVKGREVTFDPFRNDPILAAINNAKKSKLNKGTKLFIGTQGGQGTVLPRNQTVSGGGSRVNTMAQPMPTVDPQPNLTQQPAVNQQLGNQDLGVQDFLDQLMGNTEPLQEASLPSLEGFDTLSSEFDINDPLQFASLGQSYLTDAILAARRRQQSRRDYMRNMMMMAGIMPGMSNLAIGGGVNVG